MPAAALCSCSGDRSSRQLFYITVLHLLHGISVQALVLCGMCEAVIKTAAVQICIMQLYSQGPFMSSLGC